MGRITDRPPMTAARVERAVDTLACIMHRYPRDAHFAVDLWKRLQKDLQDLKDAEAIVLAARDRVRRLTDQTAA